MTQQPARLPAEELQAMLKARKPHKMGAQRTVVDGISFPSKREADRWIRLSEAQAHGVIKNLRRQVRYELTMITHYVADFEYDWAASGDHVVEDAKGFRTERYKRLKKLMRQQHGIEIKET